MKKLRKYRRLLLVFFAISTLIFVTEIYTINFWQTVETYYSDEGDALVSTEDPAFAPKASSIFFHETSYYGELTPRQACSVEAAARTHPKRNIYVLFSSPVTDYCLKTTCLSKLLEFPNVKFFRVHLAEYSKDTPVQPILLNDLKESRFPIQHAADILRMLTLNKYGGVCLETDMILVKALEPMAPNWIVKENEKTVAPGLMSFSNDNVGKNITGAILEEILKTYNPNDWAVTGRGAIQKVVKRICPPKIRWETCKDIAIYPNQLFYPVGNTLLTSNYKVSFFQPNFSVRIWNKGSNRNNNNLKLHEMLVRKLCPSIFSLYREELGV